MGPSRGSAGLPGGLLAALAVLLCMAVSAAPGAPAAAAPAAAGTDRLQLTLTLGDAVWSRTAPAGSTPRQAFSLAGSLGAKPGWLWQVAYDSWRKPWELPLTPLAQTGTWLLTPSEGTAQVSAWSLRLQNANNRLALGPFEARWQDAFLSLDWPLTAFSWEHRTEQGLLTFFRANVYQHSAQEQFPGGGNTGTFALRHGDIVSGSEFVQAQVFDPANGQIVAAWHPAYYLDYRQGLLFFSGPLPASLNGLPVRLWVSYDYVQPSLPPTGAVTGLEWTGQVGALRLHLQGWRDTYPRTAWQGLALGWQAPPWSLGHGAYQLTLGGEAAVSQVPGAQVSPAGFPAANPPPAAPSTVLAPAWIWRVQLQTRRNTLGLRWFSSSPHFVAGGSPEIPPGHAGWRLNWTGSTGQPGWSAGLQWERDADASLQDFPVEVRQEQGSVSLSRNFGGGSSLQASFSRGYSTPLAGLRQQEQLTYHRQGQLWVLEGVVSHEQAQNWPTAGLPSDRQVWESWLWASQPAPPTAQAKTAPALGTGSGPYARVGTRWVAGGGNRYHQAYGEAGWQGFLARGGNWQTGLSATYTFAASGSTAPAAGPDAGAPSSPGSGVAAPEAPAPPGQGWRLFWQGRVLYPLNPRWQLALSWQWLPGSSDGLQMPSQQASLSLNGPQAGLSYAYQAYGSWRQVQWQGWGRLQLPWRMYAGLQLSRGIADSTQTQVQVELGRSFTPRFSAGLVAGRAALETPAGSIQQQAMAGVEATYQVVPGLSLAAGYTFALAGTAPPKPAGGAPGATAAAAAAPAAGVQAGGIPSFTPGPWLRLVFRPPVTSPASPP
ncbi:MAG: hypothetical protein IMW99_09725 [Firmicutes bacterium]|nr:hypothetical protein [Bacillota bacterium]